MWITKIESLHQQRNYTDDGITVAVVDVVKENISVAGERAALNAAEQLTSSLQERANAAARARDALRAKHAQIVSFNKEVVSLTGILFPLSWVLCIHGVKFSVSKHIILD